MTWTDIVNDELTFIIPDGMLIHLETWISSAAGREVSGVGIMEKDSEAKTFTLKKCWLMAAGSVAYTEIPGAKMVKLIKEGVRPDQLKVWWHRHPVGNGIPGPHNWSGTDNNTIRNEPFGIDPSMVKWLLSIVRTPRGWVARYDSHETKKTIHMSVNTRISPKEHAATANLIEQHAQAEMQANMSQNSGQQVSLPRKRKHQYFKPRPESDDSDRPKFGGWGEEDQAETDDGYVFKQLGLKKGMPEKNISPVPIPGGVENMLKQVGWSRKTYLAVAADLRYEQPEFVAFDHKVTLVAIRRLNLITQTELAQVHQRIQEKVDGEHPEYLALIRNWDLGDL